jgi:hypothetical protein
MRARSGKRISSDTPGAQQRVDPRTGKREIEVALAYKEPPPTVLRKKPTTSYPLPWKNKGKLQKTSDNMYAKAGLGALVGEKGVGPKVGPEPAPHYRPGEGPRKYQYAKEEPPQDEIGILAKPSMTGHGGAGQMTTLARYAAPFIRTMEGNQNSTSIEGPGSNPPPPNGARHIVPFERRTNENLLTNQVQPRLQHIGPTEEERRAREAPRDILGMPVPQYDKSRIQADIDARRKAVEEEQQRSDYDHFGRVMKRTVLVDQYNKSRPPAGYHDPQGDTDIFGRPVNAYVRQQQERSLLSKPSGGVGRRTSTAPPPFMDKEPLRLFGNDTLSQQQQLQRRAVYPEDQIPTYIGPTPVNDGADYQQWGVDPYDVEGDVEGGQQYHPQRQQAMRAVGPVQRFRQTPLFQNMMVAAGGWGVCRLRHLIQKQIANNRNTALAAGCTSEAALSRAHIRGALVQFGVDVSDAELNELMALAPPADELRVAAQRRTAAAPNPRPSVVDGTRLLAILRRGEEPPAAIVDVLKQAYAQMQRNFDLRRNESLTFGEIQNATNFTGHSSFDALAPGSARKVTMGFVAAWAGVAASERVPVERFIEFWADVRMSFPRDADFIKMIKVMHGLARSSGRA